MESFYSFTVQARRERVPTLIRYFYIRALMCEASIEVATMSPKVRAKLTEEFFRRVATLMTLDWYSATHPFDKEDVEIEPTHYSAEDIYHWWLSYKRYSPDSLADLIWGEAEL